MNTPSRLLLLLLLAPPVLATTVYKSIDANGHVSFSDKPPQDASRLERIEIRDDYPTGLSAEDMARLKEMRETTERMREDRLARERERAPRPEWPPFGYAPRGESPTGDPRGTNYYPLPLYYPPYPVRGRHRHWQGENGDTSPPAPLRPNPDSASPQGLLERIRRQR